MAKPVCPAYLLERELHGAKIEAEAAREGVDAEDAVVEAGAARGLLSEQANALQIDSRPSTSS